MARRVGDSPQSDSWCCRRGMDVLVECQPHQELRALTVSSAKLCQSILTAYPNRALPHSHLHCNPAAHPHQEPNAKNPC